MRTRIAPALVALLLSVSVPGCSDNGEDEQPGLANPASVHCEEQGGTVEMRETALGVAGFCVFDDGSECDEWAYYRGECSPGSDS